MHFVNRSVLSGADTGSLTGPAIDSNQLFIASFQAIFQDVSAAGTVKIQASNDECNDGYQASNFIPTNWSDIPSATSTVASGVAPLITVPNLCYRFIRVVYTRSSGGSTTMNVEMFAQAQ